MGQPTPRARMKTTWTAKVAPTDTATVVRHGSPPNTRIQNASKAIVGSSKPTTANHRGVGDEGQAPERRRPGLAPDRLRVIAGAEGHGGAGDHQHGADESGHRPGPGAVSDPTPRPGPQPAAMPTASADSPATRACVPTVTSVRGQLDAELLARSAYCCLAASTSALTSSGSTSHARDEVVLRGTARTPGHPRQSRALAHRVEHVLGTSLGAAIQRRWLTTMSEPCSFAVLRRAWTQGAPRRRPRSGAACRP